MKRSMFNVALSVRTGMAAIASGLVLGAMTLAPAFPAAAAGTSSPPSAVQGGTIVMAVGESRVVNVNAPMTDVIIADPAIVDVHVRSKNQLYILAKAPGESNVTVTDKAGHILYAAKARVGNNLTSVDQMLRLAMPEAQIIVSNMNGMTLLTGTIKAPEDAAEAERLVQAFVGKDVTVVSRLRTATPLQVNLQVKISEVSRNLLHKVGTNLSAIGNTGGSFQGYIGRATRPFFSTTTLPNGAKEITFQQPSNASTTFGGIADLFGMNMIAALDLAETAGLATTLAQPNLTSLSGETASFLAGGEYPYSVSNGLQGNTIEFKQYGVQLAFTPTVLSDGRVSLRVRPSVTSLDFSINANVPALRSRTAETTVELGSGQSFMIAGLLSNDTSNNVDKVPGLGNVPVLGSLFKSRQFQRNETELVIVVTPYLVKPIDASDIHLPTDGFRNADEAQALLLQQSHDSESGAKAPMPRIAPDTPPRDPAVSSAPAAAPQPGADQKSRSRGKPSAQAAANTAPGFSF